MTKAYVPCFDHGTYRIVKGGNNTNQLGKAWEWIDMASPIPTEPGNSQVVAVTQKKVPDKLMDKDWAEILLKRGEFQSLRLVNISWHNLSSCENWWSLGFGESICLGQRFPDITEKQPSREWFWPAAAWKSLCNRIVIDKAKVESSGALVRRRCLFFMFSLLPQDTNTFLS
jgi:hypothetical protein